MRLKGEKGEETGMYIKKKCRENKPHLIWHAAIPGPHATKFWKPCSFHENVISL